MLDCNNSPPTGNLKCILLTVFFAGGYWYLPPRNKWVLLAIVYFTYLALAWYDHRYDCPRQLGPSYLAHFYAFAKPTHSAQIKTYRHWCPETARRILVVDMVVLVILLALAPIFWRWQHNGAFEENDTSRVVLP